MASGHRVYFSGNCSGVKGREGQHGVGLEINEAIVKKAGKDGIAIECINARFLKARISIKSSFFTSVVAYAPTEETPEGQKAKHMAAFNNTVTSVPAREYTFVFNDANAGTGKRGEGGGEADIKMLGAYGRDVLNENGKLLLGFAGDNKLALRTEHIFLHPQRWRGLQIPNHQPQEGTSTLGIYPDKAGGPPTGPLR